jgi:hypothetical protein
MYTTRPLDSRRVAERRHELDLCARQASEDLVRTDGVQRGHSLIEMNRDLGQRELPSDR